jgi:hypothetical protein
MIAMTRRAFDMVVSSVGVLLTGVFVVASGLLFWGYGFANGNVHDQLAAQKIFFPPKGSEALKSPQIGPYLNRYAGRQLTTGEQARTYADHFIAVHLNGVAGGQTYSEVSAKALQNPTDAKLAGQANTLFKGEALRGMLLNAYAFWKVGQLALIGSITTFVVAAIMAMLSVLGFWHLRRVSADEQIMTPVKSSTRVRIA